ncbi:MAG: hypothetical protein EXX96DRAFT_534397 [Benjaminiella poitrasii]|nr:MAG: hypothetical protein EXX96DRAFT_534397 [Benjaminiella poitrasii]
MDIKKKLADALLASNAANKEKIAIEANKLALEELKMEEMLALERRKLELEERKIKKDEITFTQLIACEIFIFPRIKSIIASFKQVVVDDTTALYPKTQLPACPFVTN